MKDSNPQHSCCKQDALPIELITPNAHRSLPSGRDLAARSAAVIAQRRPAQQVVDPCLAPCFKGLGGHETPSGAQGVSTWSGYLVPRRAVTLRLGYRMGSKVPWGRPNKERPTCVCEHWFETSCA